MASSPLAIPRSPRPARSHNAPAPISPQFDADGARINKSMSPARPTSTTMTAPSPGYPISSPTAPAPRRLAMTTPAQPDAGAHASEPRLQENAPAPAAPTAPPSGPVQPTSTHVPPWNVLKHRDDPIVWDLSKTKYGKYLTRTLWRAIFARAHTFFSIASFCLPALHVITHYS